MSSGKNSRLFQYIHFSITTFCFIGFAVSFYSFFVELKAEKDPNYVALCDINEHMSCSKAFTSQYGKGFGILGKVLGEKSKLNMPNSLYGMIFYTLYFFLNFLNFKWATVGMILLGIASNIMSIYLAYILIYILHDFCIVCVSTYFVNASLLFFALYKRYIHSTKDQEVKESKKQS